MNYRIADFETIVAGALAKAKKTTVESISYENEHKIFLSWFALNEGKWNSDLVRLAGLAVYGWMPTILRAEGRTGKPRNVDFGEIATFLNSGSFPSSHFMFLNGSVVGTSKFLHFWRPNEYAIWDSNIRVALRISPYRDVVTSFEQYLHDIRMFCSARTESIRDVEFALFNAGSNGKT